MPRTSLRATTSTAKASLWKMVTSFLAGIVVATNTAKVVAFRPALRRMDRRSVAATAVLERPDPFVGRTGGNVGIVMSHGGSRLFASVTGSVYEASNEICNVVVTLYTKEGCTLCDKVKEVLSEIQQESESDGSSEEKFAHSLRQIDITDDDQRDSYNRYKYDIPVLHMGYRKKSESDESGESVYWTKHRLTKEEAKEAIAEAMGGSFEPRTGRPNASALER